MRTGCLLSETAVRSSTGLRAPAADRWDVGPAPAVRQIYGHFLAPNLLEASGRGLVAKDFNFPAAYHAATGRSLEATLAEIDALTPGSRVQLACGVRVRPEDDGAVLYTPHFNGYYVNELGAELVNAACGLTRIAELSASVGLDIDATSEFVAELLLLGIVDVVGDPT